MLPVTTRKRRRRRVPLPHNMVVHSFPVSQDPRELNVGWAGWLAGWLGGWDMALHGGGTVSSVLFVTAHPDDEAMFFLPALRAAMEEGRHPKLLVALLCLSTGDAAGLGRVRVKELQAAATVLGIARDRLKVLDHNKLRDGMSTQWPLEVIRDEVEAFANVVNADAIVTFDEGGVSGHANHIAVHRGVCLLSPSRHIFLLQSVPLLCKYLGPFAMTFLWALEIIRGNSAKNIYCWNWNLALAWQAMAAHRSQFVWYRRLFVLFSCYAYVNVLQKMVKYEIRIHCGVKEEN
jgi:N-acetylglucosaminylphosphatidylinositol deacetylase